MSRRRKSPPGGKVRAAAAMAGAPPPASSASPTCCTGTGVSFASAPGVDRRVRGARCHCRGGDVLGAAQSCSARDAAEAGRRRRKRGEVRRWRAMRHLSCQRACGMEGLGSRPRDAGCRRAIGARRFRQREVRLCRHHVHVLAPRRQILRQHGWPGRQARRLRDQVHVRRPTAAAVSDRAPRRAHAGARHRLGFAAQGARRAALVPSLSGPEPQGRRSFALDGRAAELEFPVRRMPFDRLSQELRCGERHVPLDVGRGECHLRGLPRPRLEPRRLGGKAWGLRSARGDQGTRRGARRAQGRVLGAGWAERQLEAQRAAPELARDRHLRALPRPREPHFRRLRARQAAAGHAPARPPRRQPLLERRADARRGLQLGLVRAEPDACARRHVLRLPRAPLAQAARTRQCRVRAVPPAGEVRYRTAYASHRGHAGRRMRRVPHADDDLHGRRSAPRPLDAHSAA